MSTFVMLTLHCVKPALHRLSMAKRRVISCYPLSGFNTADLIFLHVKLEFVRDILTPISASRIAIHYSHLPLTQISPSFKLHVPANSNRVTEKWQANGLQ